MVDLRRVSLVALIALACALVGVAFPDSLAQAASRSSSQTTKKKIKQPAARPRPSTRCVRQRPQPFLIRSEYLHSEKLKRAGGLPRATRYRIDEYGTLDGFGPQVSGGEPVTKFIETTTFFGMPIRMHRRVIPALKCVERDLKRSCARSGYRPKAIGGYRDYNSYRGQEISNHAFGLAIDIDPDRNPCCGCVAPWPDHPKCKGEAQSIYQRTDLPRCWVQTFERYGFYWLGHDKLQDTMHFEFLGDPDRLER